MFLPKSIISRTFLVSFILTLPLWLLFGGGNWICNNPPATGFPVACTYAVLVIFFAYYKIIVPLSVFYLMYLYRKPVLYRSILSVVMALFTLAFLVWGLSFVPIKVENMWWAYVPVLFFLHGATHIGYYWLFNYYLPKFEKKK